MKKFTYIIAMISIAIILIATIFKASHLAGAAILITLGFGLLSFVFLPLAYFNLLKTTNDKLLKFVFLTAFISFFIDFIGMHFKILHLPGANTLLLLGIPLPFVLFLPTYIYYHNKRKLKTDLNFFGVVIFMVYLCVFSSFLALNTSKNVITAFSHASHEISKTNAFLASADKQSDFHLQAQELVHEIDEIKIQLIVLADKDNIQLVTSDENINYFKISGKDKNLSIQIYEYAGLNKFNQNFEVFKSKASHLKSDNTINRLLNEIDMYRISIDENEKPILTQLKLISSLNVLTDWQNKILFIEYLSAQES
ncbi:MAG: hypothetical protein JEZ09_10065 [Salinivirgaceae bacterium]|nr:hypothetical protein [Salinivirgaceae bacterium]